MNIKSLLLGSAAALVAVSGARAADAVVMVEPEPMEYVRVCDVYGTGFFYIPGTETCLKIGGYVRMRVQATDNAFNNDLDYGNLNATLPISTTLAPGAAFVPGTATTPIIAAVAPGTIGAAGFSDDDYAVNTRVRARLDFDAREETELGMLRAFVRVEATNTSAISSGQAYTMENAFLQLGGLTAGYKDSVWAEDDGLFTDNDFSVGDITQNVFSYTFAVAGFTATLSAEDDASGDFVPDVVGKLGYSGGWGSANLYGVYDEQTTNTLNAQSSFRNPNTGLFSTLTTVGLPGYTLGTTGLLFDDPRTAAVAFTNQSFYNGDLNDDDGAFALKANVTLKDLIATGSQFKIEGSYAFDPTTYTNLGNVGGSIRGRDTIVVNGQTVVVDTRSNVLNGLSSEWQIGAGYQQVFGKLTARASGFYGETFDLKFAEVNPLAPTTIREVNLGNAEYWGVGGNVEYALTTNFSVSGEVNYREIDLPTGLSDGDNTTGYLEVKRTF